MWTDRLTDYVHYQAKAYRLDPEPGIPGQYFAYIAYDLDYRGLALDESEGERLADALGSRSILLMGNHGALVVGDSVADAFDRLYYFERACQTQVLALCTGKRQGDLPCYRDRLTQALRDAGLLEG